MSEILIVNKKRLSDILAENYIVKSSEGLKQAYYHLIKNINNLKTEAEILTESIL